MNNRPPPRGGLGRGLGSLIPTRPVATELADREGGGGDGGNPSTAPADWIGRIPPPQPTGGAVDQASDVSAGTVPATAVEVTDSRGAGGAENSDGLRPVAGAYFAELPVGSISPNPRQPRQVFDEEAMAELVHSVREVGLLQPVVVRKITDHSYELIMGERRLRATKEAGLAAIPAIVRDTGDDELLRDALLENLHRAQLNPLEEAAAYRQLLDDFGCTHEELAARIGRSRPQISNTLRLLNLSAPVQRRVAAGVLSAGHARTLLGVGDPAAQDQLAHRVVAEGISVRGLEELVAVGAPGGTSRQRQRRPGESDSDNGLGELADRLSDLYDTRVKVELGRSKGRLTIEFASIEDLHRIVALMRSSPNHGDGAHANQSEQQSP